MNNPEIEMLEARIAADTARLKELKRECVHPAEHRVFQYHVNHYWDHDVKWIELSCHCCGKFWKLGDEAWAFRDPRGAQLPMMATKG